MKSLSWAVCALVLCASFAFSATFGTVVPLVGGASDLVLDEARGRLYLVNSNQNRVEVYLTQGRRFLNPVNTDNLPISAAMSRSGKYLYVTSYNASNLDVIDLDTLAIVDRVTLPARPEGVAVGVDERVLISTIGTGTGNTQNVLLVYDPNVTDSNSVRAVAVTPPPPQSPLLPPPSGRAF
jgi:YVTN family beta-propeller protein